MICAWKELLHILPPHIRTDTDRLGKACLEEVRLRINSPPELVLSGKKYFLPSVINAEDLVYVINAASLYSPWIRTSAAQGYITAPGGHRIGICGEAIMKNGCFEGVREPHSLCIRVARDFPGIAEKINIPDGSVLIIGAPGWGKTTLLRDYARKIAAHEHLAVVDERVELFPQGFSRGRYMDVLQGCPKHKGIQMLLRTMGADFIAVDEITDERDCGAVIDVSNCGVRLLASAHAASIKDFKKRNIYRLLIQEHIFDTLIMLQRDRSWYEERME